MYSFGVERHENLNEEYIKYAPKKNSNPVEWFDQAYTFAKKYYEKEINKASKVNFDEVSPEWFFQEYIWVVHATGFSAKAVSKFIDRLISGYGQYNTLCDETFESCLKRVSKVCNNPQKAKAVWMTSRILSEGINNAGWETFKNNELRDVNRLVKLPYIGNVTKYHLARNIGMLNCVKPDLHLTRMKSYWNYESEEEMIRDMSSKYDLPLGISDMIAWYYASTFGTIEMKQEGQR